MNKKRFTSFVVIAIAFIISLNSFLFACGSSDPQPSPDIAGTTMPSEEDGQADDPNDSMNSNEATAADPVVVSDGSFVANYTDVVIPGRSLDVVISRSYSSNVYQGEKARLSGMRYYEIYPGPPSDGATVVNNVECHAPSDAFDIIGEGNSRIWFSIAEGGTHTATMTIDYTYYYSPTSGGSLQSINYTKTYSYDFSGSVYSSRYGHGWDLSYNIKIYEKDSSTLVLFDGHNKRLTYIYDSSSDSYLPSSDGCERIVKNDESNYVLIKKKGIKWIFNSKNRISSIKNHNGDEITFSYDAENKLTKITDDLGRGITLSYDAKGLLDKIEDFNGRVWAYDIDSNGDLVSVTKPATTEYPAGLKTSYSYSGHNLISVTGPDNNTWLTNYYDQDSRIYEQQFGNDKFYFGYFTNYTDVTDRRGNLTRYYFDDMGLITKEIVFDSNSDPNSFATVKNYTSQNQLESQILPNGNLQEYAYDLRGNIASISVDPNDGQSPLITNITYDPNDFIKTYTDPEGNQREFIYDYEDQQAYSTNSGHLMKIILPQVETISGIVSPDYDFTYNSYGQVETMTLPDEIVIKHEYYDNPSDVANNGKLYKMIYDYGTSQECKNITHTYSYDSYGNVDRYKSPTDEDSDFDYNALNQLVQIKNELNYITQMHYNERGKLEKTSRQLGETFNQATAQNTEFGYGVLSRLETVTNSLGHISELQYNENGSVDFEMDPEGRDSTVQYGTAYGYNARDLLAGTVDAEGGQTSYEYDGNGNLVKAVDAKNQETFYSYDGYDRLQTLTFEDNTTIQYAYDKNSNVIGDKKRNGDVVYYCYNALGWQTGKAIDDQTSSVLTVDDGDSGTSSTGTWQTLTNSSCNNGDAVYITSSVATYTYEKAVNGIYMVVLRWPDFADSSDSVQVKVYDGTVLLDTVTIDQGYNPNRWVSVGAYEFSASVKIEFTSSSTGTTSLDAIKFVPAELYKYDIMGRLKDVDDGANNVSNTFDRVGNLESATDQYGRAVSYEYDASGRVTKLTYPDNSYVTYHYDQLGRLEFIKDDSVTPQILAHYYYDELNRRIKLDYGNSSWIEYDYQDKDDAADDNLGNELEEVANIFNAGADVLAYRYTYDKAGNKRSMLVGGTDLTSYDYDKTYQLTEADYPGTDLATFNYDLLGNRTSVVENSVQYLYAIDVDNLLNQYSAIDSSQGYAGFTYDSNANISTYGFEQYQYDTENRLLYYSGYVATGMEVNAYYSYDFAGRRTQKHVTKYNGANIDVITQYCYDGDQVIAEYDGSGNLLRKFVYGPGIDEPIAMIVVDGESEIWYYYHHDALGNVVALSNVNGNIAERYSYTAFGKPSTYDASGAYTGKASSLGNPYMFTGRRYDAESNLYYYRARMYSAVLGGFLQTDPIGYYDSMNLYQYCLNNPINWIDPTGKAKVRVYVERGTPEGQTNLNDTKNGAYGHAWVEITDDDGTTTNRGSYPQGVRDDSERNSSADYTESHDVTQEQADKAKDYMNSYGDDNYSPVSENCTDFVYHVTSEAGVDLPGSDWGVDWPDKLYDDLNAK